MKTYLFIVLARTSFSFCIAAPPDSAADPNAAAFQKNAPTVKSAQVIVAGPAADPLDTAIARFGGFSPTTDVDHVHRAVPRSFAVGCDSQGNAIEAVYFNDQGTVEVTTDPDILATYQRKAHKLVISAPAGVTADSDNKPADLSGPFGTPGGSGGPSAGESSLFSATIHGKNIEAVMSKTEVKKKLGPPSAIFDEGTDHETWIVKPLDPVHKIADAAITQVAAGFGIFSTTVQSAGAKANSPERTYNICFSADTVCRVSVESFRQ